MRAGVGSRESGVGTQGLRDSGTQRGGTPGVRSREKYFCHLDAGSAERRRVYYMGGVVA